MKYLVASMVWMLSLSKWTHQTNVKIAIVGGGIGGTSCAYFLREIFNDTVEIDLYEGNKIGGRVATTTMSDGFQYEVGGAVLHERNKYMSDFSNIFGFQNRTRAFQNIRLGLYNGKDFDFIGNDYYLVNLMKIVWRYGFSAKRLRVYIKEFLNKFERIYQAQADGVAFNTTSDMLQAMDPDFKDYMDMSVRDSYLKYEEFSEPLINELVQASCRVNYGQTINNVHEFVGSISMSGIEGSLWAVRGGNRKVAESLLDASKARLKAEFVTEIVHGTDSCTVTTVSGANSTYDYVVLAAPYTRNQPVVVQLKNVPADVRRFGKYHRSVSTLIIGRLRATRFPDIAVNDSPISIVSSNERDFFYAVTNVEEVNETVSTNVWKVLSPKPLTRAQIDELFEYTTDVKYFEWLAYPHYQIPTPAQSFRFADRLFYVNAVEWAASAMEMSCVSAKNVALLVRNHHAAAAAAAAAAVTTATNATVTNTTATNTTASNTIAINTTVTNTTATTSTNTTAATAANTTVANTTAANTTAANTTAANTTAANTTAAIAPTAITAATETAKAVTTTTATTTYTTAAGRENSFVPNDAERDEKKSNVP